MLEVGSPSPHSEWTCSLLRGLLFATPTPCCKRTGMLRQSDAYRAPGCRWSSVRICKPVTAAWFPLYHWCMDEQSGIRHGRHCVFKMHVHLVFVTKYRRGVFTNEILSDLRSIFKEVCDDFEAELVEFDGEDDHVHLLVNYPPKVAVSNLVNSLKGVSSRMIRQKKYPAIRKKLGAKHCGRQAISPEAAVEHPSPSSASTSSSSGHRVEFRRASLAALYIPALNGGVFRAARINSVSPGRVTVRRRN